MKFISFSVVCLTFSTVLFAQVTQTEQGLLTPDQVLEELMDGNIRYMEGELSDLEIVDRRSKTNEGQFPMAVILSCLDSRVPVEMIFDQGIGDLFVGRVAGNIENEDQLGSMEFATKLAGSKLVMVLGHSSCGAVKGATDGAKLGNLTALLAKIQPAVDAVEGFDADQRNSKNTEFVRQVIEQNVRQTVEDIRSGSSVLSELETTGTIKIVGAVYDLGTGKVSLLD